MPQSTGRLAGRVAAGIVVARILGFVRERLFAHYFGNGPAADAFRAALKIPNLIRNLLGEGTLSASFIPVYAALLQREGEQAGRRLAGVVASLLILLTAAAALVGIALAPVITDVVAPGFSGATRDLTVTLVEILFPMSGVMILSAWCLGVLNTHGRFFLSYAAPAMWNIAQIAILVGLGGSLAGRRLVVALAWGALAGSVLQVVVQLPTTLRLLKGIYWSLNLAVTGVRPVIRAWLPVLFGAGVAQVSSIVDTQLASLLGGGAVAALGYTQLLSMLPLSLFGVSIA
ncbi:MAG: murein biosynthesis integral membrane protein MurJ, partial [Gemmatimonadetes bacterium]|nr:murein biosynthesis integral membrane protein MurJ [Gemmatimonadota bacterium]